MNSSIMDIYKQMMERCEEGFPSWKTPIQRIVYYYNFFLGAVLIRLIIKTKITPNQVSLAWWAIGLAGILLICIPNMSCNIVGIFILFSADSLDTVDGEIARRKGLTSFKGHVLDVCGTTLINISLMIGIGCFAYNQTGFIWIFYLTIIALFGKSVRLFNIVSRLILIDIIESSSKNKIIIDIKKSPSVAPGHIINNEKGIKKKLLKIIFYLESGSRYLVLTLISIELAIGIHFSIIVLLSYVLINLLHILMELHLIINKNWVENTKSMFVIEE